MVERSLEITRLAQNETEHVVGAGIIWLVLQSKAEVVFRPTQISIGEKLHSVAVLRLSAGLHRRRCTHARVCSGESFQNRV